MAFSAAANKVAEAEDLQQRYRPSTKGPNGYSGNAAEDHRLALERWQRFDRRLHADVTDDWELALSERQLLGVQLLVGARPSLGLDAAQVYAAVLFEHLSRLVPIEDVSAVRKEALAAGEVIDELALVALAVGAAWVIADRTSIPAQGGRFLRGQPKPRLIRLGNRETTVLSLPRFRDEVLGFPLHLVDDRAAA